MKGKRKKRDDNEIQDENQESDDDEEEHEQHDPEMLDRARKKAARSGSLHCTPGLEQAVSAEPVDYCTAGPSSRPSVIQFINQSSQSSHSVSRDQYVPPPLLSLNSVPDHTIRSDMIMRSPPDHTNNRSEMLMRSQHYESDSRSVIMRSESELLRHQGDVLLKTGQLMNKQAELLDFYMRRSIGAAGGEMLTTAMRESVFKKTETRPDASTMIETNQDFKPPVSEATSPPHYKEKLIIEEKDFASENYFFSALKKFENEDELENLLKSTIDEIENAQKLGTHSLIKEEDIDYETTVKQESQNYEVQEYEKSISFNFGLASANMKLTIEESNCIRKLFDETQKLLSKTCPVSLYQARVGFYMQTIDIEGMLTIFNSARSAQNNYHFMAVFSMPYFGELTTR